jgi:hypothetical protein
VFPRDNIKLEKEISTDKFTIIKLNGTAGLFKSNATNNYFSIFPSDFTISTPLYDRNHDIFETLMTFYKSRNDKNENNNDTFSYAWEESKICNKSIRYAIDIASNTEILVIIGYSFPFVNRLIDEKIFKGMVRLKKIYIQDPFYDINKESKIELFKSMFEIIKKRKVEIEVVSDIREFFIPSEINKEFPEPNKTLGISQPPRKGKVTL